MSGTILHLLRHGAVAAPGRLLGHRDEPSSRAGIEACREQVDDLQCDRIITSPLRRARVAAERIGEDRGITIEADRRWMELDFGAWDGLAPEAIEAEALNAFYADPAARPPGGETWIDLVERVGAAIDSIGQGTTLIVTHGGPMRAALAHLCGFDHRQVWSFDLPCAALLSLRIFPGNRPLGQIVGLYR